MTDHPNAIKLDPGAALTDESVEVARIWITNNEIGRASCRERVLYRV